MNPRPFFKNLQPLVLASASPRRRAMLADLGLEFTIWPAAIPEVPASGETPAVFAARLAGEKARAVARQCPTTWVLAADTVVAVDEVILGKPADPAEAEQMLTALNDRWHTVWTGFCLRNGSHEEREAVATEVLFADLSAAVRRAYIATGEPLDKAGAYGIQGMGGALIREIRGSHSNVIGLPLAETIGRLLACGVISPVGPGLPGDGR